MSKLFLALFSGNNLWFTLVMLSLFVVALFGLSSSSRKVLKGIAESAPGLLTSIGIFGTFFGIVLALLDFSSNNLREGIDNIINGMQTAFITSVVGVFLSLILKIIGIIREGREAEKELKNSDESSGSNLIQKFVEQSENSGKLVECMQTLLTSIGSDSDHSMLGQIRLLRADFSDNFKAQQKQIEETYAILKSQLLELTELKGFGEKNTKAIALIGDSILENKEIVLKFHQDISEMNQVRSEQMKQFKQDLTQQLNTFAEILSRSATEQIIDALRQVIADFNQHIEEQFGENFKHLNDAVGKLLQWQENYKQQLQHMGEQYEHGVQAIKQTEEAVSSIEHSAQAIPNSMEKLRDIISMTDEQVGHSSQHLYTFAELRDKAIQALPQVQSHIDIVLESMENGSKQIQQTMNKAAQDFELHTQNSFNSLMKISGEIQDNSKEIQKYSQEMSKSLNEAAYQFITHIEQGKNKFNTSLRELQEAFSSHLQNSVQEQRRMLHGLSDEAEKALSRTGESMKNQLEAMDRAMNEEIRRVMQSMGSSLVTITKTFTKDYRELVDAMDRVVRYGRNGVK